MCVNVRFQNATVSRLGYLQGLPYNTTCCVATEPNGLLPDKLWVGTSHGAARYDSTTRAWQYFYLQRYLPGNSQVTALATGSGVTVVATDGGLALLEAQSWTLEKKAAHFEDILARHNRVGESSSSGSC